MVFPIGEVIIVEEDAAGGARGDILPPEGALAQALEKAGVPGRNGGGKQLLQQLDALLPPVQTTLMVALT